MKKNEDFYRETYSLKNGYRCEMQKYHTGGVVTPAHVHSFVEVLYGVDCDYRIYADDKIYHFQSGDLIFFFSNQVHKIETLSTDPMKHIYVQFTHDIITDASPTAMNKYIIPFMLKNKKNKCYFKAEEIRNLEIRELMENVYDETKNRPYGYEVAVKTYMQRIALFWLREWNREKDQDINLLDETRMLDIFEYIEENYQEHISASELAQKYYVSCSYFSRWFKRVTGQTFKQYLNSVRINRAAELLANSNRNVTEIAMMTGFPTTSYFIKQFKLLNGGCSPKKFKTTYNK